MKWILLNRTHILRCCASSCAAWKWIEDLHYGGRNRTNVIRNNEANEIGLIDWVATGWSEKKNSSTNRWMNEIFSTKIWINKKWLRFVAFFPLQMSPGSHIFNDFHTCTPFLVDEFQMRNRILNESIKLWVCNVYRIVFFSSCCTFNRKTFIGKLYSLVFHVVARDLEQHQRIEIYMFFLFSFVFVVFFTTCKHFPFKPSEKHKHTHAWIALPDRRFKGFLKIN